ncbi:MAG: BREX-1 system phosphatase PglZ type B [Acidobacteriota bacterium]|nr:BREX-1 system phosphatase PglZ type B [Acidobacteriota bacterium]
MNQQRTVLDALLEQLAAQGQYNANEVEGPAAILWPDPERQFEALAPRLRQELPHFLTLGPYSPGERTGPAIWIRCMLERTLPEADWPEDAVPIVYLPGVSRRDLRASDECPKELQPLVDLQYAGTVWSQVSHRDWTVMAFLVSDTGGLGLDVAKDDDTREAVLRALVKLADCKVEELRGRRLERTDFDNLINPDGIQQILRWLNDPQGYCADCDGDAWHAFRNHCAKHGFDPDADGPLVAAEKLGARQGEWETVWQRFAEAPANYPGIPAWLDRAAPEQMDSLFDDESSWPKFNAQREKQLRAALLGLDETGPEDARSAIAALEGKHGERRGWVWAKLGMAPLAVCLEHLAALAEHTAKPLLGATPEEMAEAYVNGRWQADAEALAALNAVRQQEDISAARTAIRAVYARWLEDAAILFQSRLTEHGVPEPAPVPEVAPGCCVLFADGLRFDLARELSAALQKAGMEHTLDWNFAALPSVTATTKPAVSPIADQLTGAEKGADFMPCLKTDGKPLTTDRFRKLLAEQGIVFLQPNETGDPSGKAWTEWGSIDKQGHAEQWKLAWRIEEEVNGLLDRVRSLKSAGWSEVRIVTDHGWLLLPGGLPKLELPAYLAESRWGRCAELRATSQVTLTTVDWCWNPDVRIAMASGISCFAKGYEFAHGGLSLQECVAPVLVVGAAKEVESAARIVELTWSGLRVRAKVEGASGLKFDVRTKPADAGTSVIKDGQPVAVADNGTVTALVTDDDLIGTTAAAVVLGGSGEVLAKMNVEIGGTD